MIVNEEKLQEERKKVRERVRVYWQRKKEQVGSEVKDLETELPFGSFKCPQCFGKAVCKVKKLLSSSPSKKAVVVRKLVSDIVGTDLSDEQKSSIMQFYCSDEISWQA